MPPPGELGPPPRPIRITPPSVASERTPPPEIVPQPLQPAETLAGFAPARITNPQIKAAAPLPPPASSSGSARGSEPPQLLPPTDELSQAGARPDDDYKIRSNNAWLVFAILLFLAVAIAVAVIVVMG